MSPSAPKIVASRGPVSDELLTRHVTVPDARPPGRAFVRLNMISSADGATALMGVSGGLGNAGDHRVFQALRDTSDAVVVGIQTVLPEHYRPPDRDDLTIYVVATEPDVSGDPALFAAPNCVLVLPEDAAAAPDGVRELRVGTNGQVDLAALVAQLDGQIALLEGGPGLAGVMVAQGLVDEFFHTVAPFVVGGSSARPVHGADGDPTPWHLVHGFDDEDGYLFLRYARR